MTTPTETKIKCPFCESQDVSKRVEKRQIGDRFTGMELIDEFFYSCDSCGAEGDFANQNDEIYDRAIKALSPKAMNKMLKTLNEKGITLAHLERCLDLPQRTTARWKRDGASTAAITLMKFIITYPWLLDVADKNFDPVVANNTLMQEGIKNLNNVVNIFQKRADIEVLAEYKTDQAKQANFIAWAGLNSPAIQISNLYDQDCVVEQSGDENHWKAMHCHLAGSFQPQQLFANVQSLTLNKDL